MNETELLEKFANGSITMEEAKAFREHRKGSTPGELEDLETRYRDIWSAQPQYGSVKEDLYLAMEERIRAWESAPATQPVHRVHFLKTTWFRYAAILLIIAVSSSLIYRLYERPSQQIVQQTPEKNRDIQPGGNKATLTLSDGTRIVLDSAANGALATQGNTKILKVSAGSLAYQGERSAGVIGYNTIQTPKGGQYQILLPDGTRVWLNAASSIRFPTAFTDERRVTVTGEVYLEVSPDAEHPFTVMTSGNREIRVLGTSFNINAYQEEPAMKTTLMQGSINVILNNQPHVLKPGQQAVINNTGNTLNITSKADLEQVIAWKNGAFDFEGAKLPEVMRQIERWYNVTVVYEKGIPDIEFVGKMGRSMPLSGMIAAFARMGIHCRVEAGGKLIVTL